jgi:tetratricopeptide (TPR) repeat protein
LITKSQFEQAIELLKKAVSLDPNYVDAWSNLASCFEHENNLPEAIKSIQEAIKNAINLPKYHYILGKLLLKAQVNPKLAKFSFKNALVVNPTHTPSLFCLGSMYLNEKKIEKAERLLAACVKLGDFEEKETLTRYALCCAQLGKNEQAIKSFEKIIENYKDDPLSKKQLELAYKSLKKLKNF